MGLIISANGTCGELWQSVFFLLFCVGSPRSAACCFLFASFASCGLLAFALKWTVVFFLFYCKGTVGDFGIGERHLVLGLFVGGD